MAPKRGLGPVEYGVRFHCYYSQFHSGLGVVVPVRVLSMGHIQCNPDIRQIFSGPKLEPVLPKQNRPKPDIKENRI